MTSPIVPIKLDYPGSNVRCYFIEAEMPTLIDTGGVFHPEREILAGLSELGYGIDRIEQIINTHGHWDHAGGNSVIQAATGGKVKVAIHALGAPLLADSDAHLAGYSGIAARALGRQDLLEATAASFGESFQPSDPPDRMLADGDQIDLGDVRLTAIATPGHSEDHLSYYWEDGGVLISGDAAQGTGSRAGGCPLYFGSVAQARASIQRLQAVPFRELQVSHPFGRLGTDERVTTYDAESGMAFLADSLVAIDRLESALIRALKESPESPLPDLIRAAVAIHRQNGTWPTTDDPATGVPAGFAVTVARLYAELN